MSARYRLFSWEHSYFSGKVRAYLRYKQYFDDLDDGYEDILATPELIQGLLVPATGSNVKKVAGRLYEDALMNHRTQENPI